MNHLKKLTEISGILLNEEENFGTLFTASKNLKELLLSVSELPIINTGEDENLYTDSGKAVGVKWASLCVNDFIRTKRFCTGLFKAVKKKVSEKKEPVHIVYAGTGPFATLILPLLTQFSSKEITVTLLELNEISFENLKKVLTHFDAWDYVKDIELCDATSYKIKNPNSVDIIVSETMMHGLKKEPQVAISYSLMLQVPESVILIPEEIQLRLLLINHDKRQAYKLSLNGSQNYSKTIGVLFTLNKSEIKTHRNTFLKTFPNTEFPKISLSIPDNANRNFNELAIETYIKVFEDQEINIDESGLSILLKVIDLNPMIQTVSTITSKYLCGKTPGLQLKLGQ